MTRRVMDEERPSSVELHGGPLDGELVDIHPRACEYRKRLGGERPRPRYVPGEGMPLLPLEGAQLVVYRRAQDGRFEYSEAESDAEVARP